MIEPIYIGDGIYAFYDESDDQVVLTTGNHVVMLADNVIYLDRRERDSLAGFLTRVAEATKR